MDIQRLKDNCNEQYAQAIFGFEQGKEIKDIAICLLNAASRLAELAKVDIIRRTEYETKARRLLSAAKSLRETGDLAAVYKDLTGRTLTAALREQISSESFQTMPKGGDTENLQAEETVRESEEPFSSETETQNVEEEMQAESSSVDTHASKDAEQCKVTDMNDLRGLLHSKKGKEKSYGNEDTSGYRFVWDDLPRISFDDVAGLADVKEAVTRKVLLPLKAPELYEGYIKKNGGGLLLYGPPGTGKTMIAAAIAHEIGAKFCSLGPSDLVLGGIGNSEKAAVALFKEARSFPCAVLFFDEIESICPVNTHAQGARQLRSELLRQIQGMETYGEQNDKILFLIAATNKPWDIDPAFVRPGRFGTRIFVGLPDESAREYMLHKRLDKIAEAGKVDVGAIDYAKLVEKTVGFNGADITNLLDEVQELSAFRSVKTGIKEILQEDFDCVLKKLTTSVQQKDMQKLLAWKEQNG